MRRRNQRHHTRIHNTQPIHAVDPQLRIHNAAMLPPHHRARAARVRQRRHHIRPHRRPDILVRLHCRRVRVRYDRAELFECWHAYDAAEVLDHVDEDLDVGGVGEDAVVDDGVGEGVGRVYEDGAAAKRFLERVEHAGEGAEGVFADGDAAGGHEGGEEGALELVAGDDGCVGVGWEVGGGILLSDEVEEG